MERIASFTVDHLTLQKGMYISRVDCGDIVTYDIRMKRPNNEDYLGTGGLHTFEHLFATHARNSAWKEHVVYVGPMGCRTGFYLITKALPHADALQLVQQSLAFIQGFSGDIPGATAIECGNYLDQDLDEARAVAQDMAAVLQNWDETQMTY